MMPQPMDSKSLPVAPAPWSLSGRGFVLVYRFAPALVRSAGVLPDPLREAFAGGFGAVMLVDYASSEVGPYRELLFIPGQFRFEGRQHYSIARIYVSSPASVVNGRENWAIPKELAEFEWDLQDGIDRVQVRSGGRTVASLAIRARGPQVPVSTKLVPGRWRTLMQRDEAWTWLTVPEGRGRVRMAKLVEAQVDAALFPDFTQGRLIAAFEASRFQLCFPAAERIRRGGRP